MLLEEKIVIIVEAEHSTCPGTVVFDPEVDEDGYPVSDDHWHWGEGTEAELIAQAREELAQYASGGGTSAYKRKCARNVLDYFHEDE